MINQKKPLNQDFRTKVFPHIDYIRHYSTMKAFFCRSIIFLSVKKFVIDRIHDGSTMYIFLNLKAKMVSYKEGLYIEYILNEYTCRSRPLGGSF